MLCNVSRLVAVSDESVFGDFEDLETGEVHRAADNENSEEEEEEEEELSHNDQGSADMVEKKKRKKAAFDAMYP